MFLRLSAEFHMFRISLISVYCDCLSLSFLSSSLIALLWFINTNTSCSDWRRHCWLCVLLLWYTLWLLTCQHLYFILLLLDQTSWRRTEPTCWQIIFLCSWNLPDHHRNKLIHLYTKWSKWWAESCRLVKLHSWREKKLCFLLFHRDHITFEENWCKSSVWRWCEVSQKKC